MGLLAIRFQFRHDLTQTLLREYDIMHGKDGERVLLRTPKKIDAALYALEENVPRLMQEASQLSGYAPGMR